jgi:hypothetical protein
MNQTIPDLPFYDTKYFLIHENIFTPIYLKKLIFFDLKKNDLFGISNLALFQQNYFINKNQEVADIFKFEPMGGEVKISFQEEKVDSLFSRYKGTFERLNDDMQLFWQFLFSHNSSSKLQLLYRKYTTSLQEQVQWFFEN